MDEITSQWSSLWIPPTKLSLSDWTEQHLVLSSEYSSRSGLIKLFGFQKAIMDAFSDPTVRELVIMAATQLIKTILIQAIIAYVIANEPGPILVIQPKDDAAKKFSKRRIVPMLRDNYDDWGHLVTDSGAGKEGTIQEKSFPGGSLSIVGAGSPTNLASASICYLLCDEIDKYEASVGNQGDPIIQAKKRLSTYGSRSKLIKVCSPTNEHTSHIARDYQGSDQREPWVGCHACAHPQVLKFSQVKWDNSLPVTERPATAHYECISCGAHWSDIQRWKACEELQWKANKPFAGIAGFWINHLYSPWHKLSEIVEEFFLVQHSWEERVGFTNLTLAELWKQDGIAPDDEKLYARRETYSFGDDAVVPRRACFLTASVDVQHDRLEAEVVAWGRNKESWSIAYELIQPIMPDGVTPYPVTSPQMWNELDRRIINRDFRHENGGTLPIMLMGVDTGYNAPTVYEYCLRHLQLGVSPAGAKVRGVKTVVALKGTDDALKIISGHSSENASRKRGVVIQHVGTHCAKSELYDNLRNARPLGEEPVPNCLHFPMYAPEYFKGLCSENRMIHANGKSTWEKKPNARNEPLDLKVYNRACATLCGIDAFTSAHWDRMEARINSEKVQPAEQAEPTPTPLYVAQPKPQAPKPQPQRRRLGGFAL